jgi:hypothetical protein
LDKISAAYSQEVPAFDKKPFAKVAAELPQSDFLPPVDLGVCDGDYRWFGDEKSGLLSHFGNP